MDKRVRSPNYPAISLPDALEKVATLYKSMHTHEGPREVVAKAMGYASLNGSSMTVISALHKYGLLQGRGEEIRVSDRAMRILHPESPEERAAALSEAGSEPQLFSELDERFPGEVPNEELLRNYLVRRGFAPSAVSQVIRAYRETKELVAHEGAAHDSRSSAIEGAQQMLPSPSQAAAGKPAVSHKVIEQNQSDERLLARYDFEGGGHIRILVGSDVATEEALDMAETLINLKRKEIARRKAAAADSPAPPESEDEDSDA